MKLHVLVDNNTLIDRYFVGEPAVSYLIEEGDLRILFDVGYSDIFLQNAHKMNQDLLQLDYLILSHGHMDHTWGMEALIRAYTEAAFEKIPCRKPVVITHPDTFLSKYSPGFPEFGSIVSQETAAKNLALQLSREPVWLSSRLVFLGEIERQTSFEAQHPIGTVWRGEQQEADYLTEDSALVYCAQEGLVIITGCSHAGICNIIEQARRVCQEERILDIIGGFHLLNPSTEQMQGTIDYFKVLQPQQIHACHCTDLTSKIALSRVVKIEETGVGTCLNYK
jgi:7,8-dihydropterin-6-yl-methyl-4-(beta-D-ribofuranosyl)aminobenzene 5'-phosphate synthase